MKTFYSQEPKICQKMVNDFNEVNDHEVSA